jgi:adenylate cyclase
VRISAQLIDATTADHIWAERYDRDLADIFGVQDEITAAVTGAIGPAIMDAEQRRAARKPPANLNAWEAYLLGQWHDGQRTAADRERAKELFQRAVALDATFSAPYVALARAYIDDAAGFGARSQESAAELSASWAQRAIAIDPEDADARAMLALAAQVAGNADAAHDQIQLARNCNPNSPMVLAVQGHVLLFTGQPAQARQAYTACLRLDPRGPLSRRAMHQLATSYYYEGDYAEAVEAQRRTWRGIQMSIQPTGGSQRRQVSWAGQKRRGRRCGRRWNFHPRRLNSTPVADPRGTGPRTTSTCWTACAKLAGRANVTFAPITEGR